MVDSINREKMAAEKTCRLCGVVKTVADFYQSHARCKECMRPLYRERYHANKPPPKVRVRERLSKEESKARAFKRNYGITLAERDAMLAAQGGVCAICGGDDPIAFGWNTDHDHSCCPRRAGSCGKCIRGILCRKCNLGIGFMDDSIETLRAAIDYLTTWEARNG